MHVGILDYGVAVFFRYFSPIQQHTVFPVSHIAWIVSEKQWYLSIYLASQVNV